MQFLKLIVIFEFSSSLNLVSRSRVQMFILPAELRPKRVIEEGVMNIFSPLVMWGRGQDYIFRPRPCLHRIPYPVSITLNINIFQQILYI